MSERAVQADPAHGGTYSRRDLVVGGAMIATAATSGVLTFRAREAARTRQAPPLDGLLPDRIGSWTRSSADGVFIPRGEGGEGSPYDDLATRYYTSAAAPAVMLLIAYGGMQTGDIQLHRPEICYPAAGYGISHGRDVTLELGRGLAVPARTLTARTAETTERILYWSRVGNAFPTSNAGQRLAVFRQSLAGLVPDGCLVRMSAIVEDDDALAVLRDFARALVATPSAELRRLLVGRA